MQQEKTMKGLYTIIYPFMATALNLAGLVKECFAVIFGFWFNNGKTPVGVSLTTMQTITGASRPTVVKAVQKLEKDGLIILVRRPGRKTLYSVTIPERILDGFVTTYTNKGLVKGLNQQELFPLTSTGKISLLQNERQYKYEKTPSSLRVKSSNEIKIGGMKEV